MSNKRKVGKATDRPPLAVCLKFLAKAQRAVADGKWIERGMDIKINRILCPKYFNQK